MKDIVVFSRNKIEELADCDDALLRVMDKEFGPIAVISIISPGEPEVKLPRIAKYILRLEFDDISPKQDGVEIPILGGGGWHKLKMANSNDALKIVTFINEVRDKVNLLIVHCAAGISRSAGVGIAIAEETNLDKVANSLLSSHAHYNRDVYRIVKEGFCKHSDL